MFIKTYRPNYRTRYVYSLNRIIQSIRLWLKKKLISYYNIIKRFKHRIKRLGTYEYAI